MTVKKTTYYATLPDGCVVRRGTSRHYSHAVAIRPNIPAHLTDHAWEREHHHAKWGTAGFCGSLALAEKLAEKERRYYQGIGASVEIEILETHSEPEPSETPSNRVARGLHPQPGPHCVECSEPLTAAELAKQEPDHDEICDACAPPSVPLPPVPCAHPDHRLGTHGRLKNISACASSAAPPSSSNASAL